MEQIWYVTIEFCEFEVSIRKEIQNCVCDQILRAIGEWMGEGVGVSAGVRGWVW